MPSAIEDVSSLPGETVRDQDGRKLGEVKEIYAVGESNIPMWVAVEASTGIGRSRLVFIPIARLKQEEDQIRTPYSYQHLQDSPEVEAGDELSEEDDRTLRGYYSVGVGDQEVVQSAQSYASQVPDEDEPAHKADADDVEGQVRELDETPPAERAAKADEEQREKEDDDGEDRKATAEDILGEQEGDSKGEKDGDSDNEKDGDSANEEKDEDKDGKEE